MKWLLILVLPLLSACQQITVKDKEVCGDLGSEGAHCAHTLIVKTRDIKKAQWDLERVGWLCTNSTGYTDTETTIDAVCQVIHCDFETQQKVAGALTKMRAVAKKALAAQKKHRTLIKEQLGVDIDAMEAAEQ